MFAGPVTRGRWLLCDFEKQGLSAFFLPRRRKLSEGTGMKTICLSQTRCLTAVSLMLVGVLLTCYSAMVNLRRGGIEDIEKIADVVPAEEDGEAEYLEKRHEFLDRFFG